MLSLSMFHRQSRKFQSQSSRPCPAAGLFWGFLCRNWMGYLGWNSSSHRGFVCKLSESAAAPLQAGVSVPLDSFLEFSWALLGRISALCWYIFTHLCSVSPALSTAGDSLSAFGTGAFHCLTDAQTACFDSWELVQQTLCTPPQFPMYRLCTKIRGMVFTWEGL